MYLRFGGGFLPAALGFTLFLAAPPARADTISVFGTGFSLPESITAISGGFGLSGAGYIIPDPTVNFAGTPTVYTLPAVGGAPTSLATLGFAPLGGLILPSGYSNAGNYLAVGEKFTGLSGRQAVEGEAVAIDSSGHVSPLLTDFGTSAFTSAVVAPAGFGSVGGQVLIADENDGLIYSLAPGGSRTLFADIGNAPPTPFGAAPFGLAFAPVGFGFFGGDLLASDPTFGDIYAIDGNGNVNIFATLSGVDFGLRQMAFAPAGFGAYGGDLFVSVAGASGGGGTLGSVVAVNPFGIEDATIKQGTFLTPSIRAASTSRAVPTC